MEKTSPLTHDEIARMVGHLDDTAVAAIFVMSPTAEELAEALAWAEGEDDVDVGVVHVRKTALRFKHSCGQQCKKRDRPHRGPEQGVYRRRHAIDT